MYVHCTAIKGMYVHCIAVKGMNVHCTTVKRMYVHCTAVKTLKVFIRPTIDQTKSRSQLFIVGREYHWADAPQFKKKHYSRQSTF